MPPFPYLCLLAKQTTTLLIVAEIVSDIRTVVAGEDDERVFNQSMPRPTRIVGRFEGLDKLAKGNVVLEDHVLSITRGRRRQSSGFAP